MQEAARGVCLKGIPLLSHLLPGRGWLGARGRHTRGEELFREIELFRLHLGEREGHRVSNKKRGMAAKAPRVSLLHIRNLTEQDSQWKNRLHGAEH